MAVKTDQVALVTGASSGIGEAAAHELDAGHGGVFQFHEDFVKRATEFLSES